MTTANERQHGGDHYKKHEYQHWDFACDTGQPYLVGCATKYASRWRDKGGKVDLEKMIHYLDKAEERGVHAPGVYGVGLVDRYTDQLVEPEDGKLVSLIMRNDWAEARELAHKLLSTP